MEINDRANAQALLREKCPNTEFLQVRIFPVRTEYGEILFIISPNAVKYDQKKLQIWTLFTQCSEYALYPLN